MASNSPEPVDLCRMKDVPRYTMTFVRYHHITSANSLVQTCGHGHAVVITVCVRVKDSDHLSYPFSLEAEEILYLRVHVLCTRDGTVNT